MSNQQNDIFNEHLNEIQEDTTSMEEKLYAIDYCGCQYEGEAKCCHEDCKKKHRPI